MPNDLVCPTCNRVYPWQVPREKCSTCGYYFTRGTCYVCREYKDELWHGGCKECKKIGNRNWMRRAASNANDEYDAWVASICAVPKPVRLLTEDEWDRICNYFKGCALCGAMEIESRILYVPGHRGGVYTKFNVLPVCEKCATSYKQQANYKGNPFENLWFQYTAEKRRRLESLKKYLHNMLEEYNDESRSI